MADNDNVNINDNILALLGGMGLMPRQNFEGATEPEILEYLRGYGTRGMNNKDPYDHMRPVGPDGFQAVHWTQGLAQLVNAARERASLDTYNRALVASRRRVPNANSPPPGTEPPPPGPNGQIQTGQIQPPNVNGQVTPPPNTFISTPHNLGNTMFGGDDLGPNAHLFRTPNPNPNNAPAGGATEMTGNDQLTEQPFGTTPRGPLPPNIPENPDSLRNNQTDLGDELPEPSGRVYGHNEELPPDRNIVTNSNPDRQPPTGDRDVPGITVENTGRRHIDGMPVYRNEDYNLFATFPRTPPIRWGLTYDQEAAIRGLQEEDRKRMESSLQTQWTPQYTDVLGGRRWVLPATGETGFIPTPLVSTIRTPNGLSIQTVTLFDRNGRRQTFVLEPGQSPPPNSQVLPGDEQPPGNDLPGNRQSGNDSPGPGLGMFDTPFFRRADMAFNRQTAEQETSRQYSAGNARTVQEIADSGRSAQQVVHFSNLLEGLLSQPHADQMVTGRLAAPLVQFARDVNGILRGAGREPLFDENRVTMAEIFDKLNILLAAPASHQLTNRPTQFDFQSFIRTNPSIANSVQGSRLMVRIIRGLAERDRELATYASRFQQERGRTGNSQGFIEGLNRIYDQHTTPLAELMLSTPGIRIPRGFRHNGYEFFQGNDPSNPDNWRQLTGNIVTGPQR